MKLCISAFQYPQCETAKADAHKQLKIQQEVGVGGFASVYKAIWTSKEQIVAVKRIRLSQTRPQRFRCFLCLCSVNEKPQHHEQVFINREEAENEELILNELQDNSFVLKFHFSVNKPREFWIVTEWCVAHLGELLPVREGWHNPNIVKTEYSAGVVIYIGTAIMSALSHMHSRGLVHRDVKPENILVTSRGVPKLADFGTAVRVASTAADQVVDVAGTRFYTAPHVFFGASWHGWCDVWFTGIVMGSLAMASPPKKYLKLGPKWLKKFYESDSEVQETMQVEWLDDEMRVAEYGVTTPHEDWQLLRNLLRRIFVLRQNERAEASELLALDKIQSRLEQWNQYLRGSTVVPLEPSKKHSERQRSKTFEVCMDILKAQIKKVTQ